MLLLLLLLLGEKVGDIEAMTWLKAASRLSKDLTAADEKTLNKTGFRSAAEVVSRFAAARKTTINTVRRQLAATAFLESVLSAEDFKTLLENETPPPFNTIEVLKKLHAVNAQLGQSLLPKALNRSVTYAQMTENYQSALADTPSTEKRISIGRQATTEFEKDVLDSLMLNPKPLYPGVSQIKVTALRRSVPDFVFALPDGMATFDGGNEIKRRHDGIEIRMPADAARHQVWQILERLQLMSTFFTHTWLILPLPVLPDQVAFTDTLVTAKSTLGLPSVGIATATVSKPVEFKIFVSPTGLPEIDRRHLLPQL